MLREDPLGNSSGAAEKRLTDRPSERAPARDPITVTDTTATDDKQTDKHMGQGQSSVPNEELCVLLELFDALDGERWRRRDGWKQPTVDPETWYGVEVMLGHVVAIELPANELSGTIPVSIERLTHLRVLNLSKNKLRGACASVRMN